MKYYKVELYVGDTYVGTYKVEASNPEQAREFAWDCAECEFCADEREISKEEYEN